MKSANDNFYTCSMFRENVNAYIDDYLPENIKVDFLAHVKHCESCNKLLKESQRLKTLFEKLTPVTVSPEFDFRLKKCIRLENTRLQNPFYRFKLFVHENVKTAVIVPAAALIILASVFSRFDVHFYQNDQAEITRNIVSTTNNDIVPTFEDSLEEVVNYVLDSIKPGEAETGIFLNEQNTKSQIGSVDPNIQLISY